MRNVSVLFPRTGIKVSIVSSISNRLDVGVFSNAKVWGDLAGREQAGTEL